MIWRRWAISTRWYASGGSMVRDTEIYRCWTYRGAVDRMREYMGGDDPYATVDGRNALVLTDLLYETEEEVYRW